MYKSFFYDWDTKVCVVINPAAAKKCTKMRQSCSKAVKQFVKATITIVRKYFTILRNALKTVRYCACAKLFAAIYVAVYSGKETTFLVLKCC